MSFGKHTSWRLLSPLAVLFWLATIVALGSPAHADGDHANADSRAAEHAQADTASTASTASSASTASEAKPATPAPQAAEHKTSAAKSSAKGSEHGGSGDLTSPQPISNADANDGGANGQCPGGPYCSTRDGSPSLNGNGGGNATGKPCAGCVGKADNKNPPGQMPNGSDANAGYECDTNHGIGKTNPAHTGCQPTTPPPCVPTPEQPCVVTPPVVTPPVVSPPSVTPPVVSPPTAAAPEAEAAVLPAAAGLPQTGAPADLAWLAGAALASILAGSGLLFGRRRRYDDSAS